MVMPRKDDTPPTYRPQPEGNGKPGVGARQIILYSLIISIIVTFGMFQFVFFGQLVSRTDFNTNIQAMNDTIASNKLNTDQYALKSDLDNYAKNNALGAYALKSEVLNPDLSDYYTREEVDAAIAAALETQQEEEEEEEALEYVRWRNWEASFTNDFLEMGLTYNIDSDRIEEPGIYDVELRVYNNTTSDIDSPQTIITMAIEPKDDCMIDEDATSLWYVDSPFTEWDTKFIIVERHGIDLCRRAIFNSISPCDFGTIPPGGFGILELEFELYYAE